MMLCIILCPCYEICKLYFETPAWNIHTCRSFNWLITSHHQQMANKHLLTKLVKTKGATSGGTLSSLTSSVSMLINIYFYGFFSAFNDCVDVTHLNHVRHQCPLQAGYSISYGSHLQGQALCLLTESTAYPVR